MSFRRHQSFAINTNAYLDNRLTDFTNRPMYTNDLLVKRNCDICGNLTVGHDIRANNFYATGNYYLDGYVLLPPGSIIQSAAINAPAGWFDCDGRELNATEYPELFAAIGYHYGGAEGIFNIPDTRGRVAVALGQGDGLTNRPNLGATGGEETHTLSINEMPSHSHTLTRRSNPDNGAFDTNDDRKAESSACTTDRDIKGTFSTYSTGSGQAHNNMQPFFVLRYLIKY